MTANALYMLATRYGALSVTVTLSSLYPASTIILARLVLGERLNGWQVSGVACALLAITSRRLRVGAGAGRSRTAGHPAMIVGSATGGFAFGIYDTQSVLEAGWIGLAFQLDWVFPEYFQGPWSELLGNGVTVGGMTVIALTLFQELTGARRQRLRVALSTDAYPKIDAFLAKLGARRRWSEEMVERVRAVGEETLLLLIRKEEERTPEGVRGLLLIARGEGDAAVLEFIAATDATNLEDQMAVLSERAVGGLMEQEVSLRLLRHYASSVRHSQYHDTDVITVRVESAHP